MKKIFIIATLLISTLTFSQSAPLESRPPQPPVTEKKVEAKTSSNWGEYVSFSTFFSNQEGVSTLKSAYYTIEAGVCYKNLSGGLGFGKNFQGDPSTNNWFVEPRFVWNVLDLTAFKAGVIGGFGTFLAPDKPFIREYGIGTEVDTEFVNYTLQFTNWGSSNEGYGTTNYLAIGICKSF